MEYTKHLSEPWFSLIKLGLKTCEGRLNKGDFANLKVNDILIFYNEDFPNKRIIKLKIKKLTKFNSFKTFLKKKTLKKTLPGIQSYKEGLDIYHKYYSEEDENKYKIIALEFIVI